MIAICAWSTNVAFLIHSKSTPSLYNLFERSEKSWAGFWYRYHTGTYSHPPAWGLRSADSSSAAIRCLGACARRLRSARYREQPKKHHCHARFRCRLTPHNACWSSSPAPRRHHVWLGAAPLEAGQWRSVSPSLIIYVFPI